FASAPSPNPKRRHVVTRRDYCFQPPPPVSLSYLTPHVCHYRTNNKERDWLFVREYAKGNNSDRGITGALLVGLFGSSVLRFSSSFYHPPL
ncbi:hypothetical protein N7447_003797, partial [Penicillium robsamsonii]|uniref:uncharacterized protein n=1 Tax=Penicillium robsamsonii TaxID=1792511 RepID=UPI00254885DF